MKEPGIFKRLEMRENNFKDRVSKTALINIGVFVVTWASVF